MQRRDADGLRVGVVDLVAQVVAAEDDDEAMLAHRLDEDLDAGDLDRLQLLAHGDAAFGGRPAGAAVGDLALGVDGAEVAADGDVARADLEVDAERLRGCRGRCGIRAGRSRTGRGGRGRCRA